VRLVKLDLLGNRNLSTVREACGLVARHRGRCVDIEALPPDDAATRETLRRARTIGCNQLESPAMRHLLCMMRPSETRDVMKVLALIRPGAAGIGMKETFIRRMRGLAPVPPQPPEVAEILQPTCGVMLYEDDVMLVAAAMLGCSLSEADRFRKAIQKCPTDERRLELSREFLSRCKARGLDMDYAKDIWVQMAKYNAYSFCRAHAASYALLAYGGAYLKTHFPLEFWTACLNNNQSMYHPRVYVEEAKRNGVRFDLPDVNRSSDRFTIEDGAIRIGLDRIDGLGPAAVERILQGRRSQPYDGITDFLLRTRMGQAETDAMILCGAFDRFGRNRPTQMMEHKLFAKVRPPRDAVGPALFSVQPRIPDIPEDYDEARKYIDQRRVLGFTPGRHIMDWFRPFVATRTNADSRDLPHRIGQNVCVSGVVEARRTTPTASGRPMLFLTIEDEWGLMEITAFPDLAERCADQLRHYGPYLISGRVEDQHDSISIRADDIRFLPGIWQRCQAG
jgi:DNA polymerase III alpha subunit